jgi:hypothetical protein
MKRTGRRDRRTVKKAKKI